MTTQTSDLLIDSGEQFHIRTYPLELLDGMWKGQFDMAADFTHNYFQHLNAPPPRFADISTALNRRYVATWTVIKEKLFLTAFYAKAFENENKELTIRQVFGVSKLFAFWYSGEIYSNSGKALSTSHEPAYEQNIVWEFKYGVLTRRYTRDNQPIKCEPFSGKRFGTCFSCGGKFDSDHNAKCSNCSWVICECGACGCTWSKTSELIV